ncbi:MAG: transrane protein, partial [Mycobacterium sp.]|nr:transrane protein [Mycobacterium sp.]
MPERADTGAMPLTEPHEAPIFDTGPHPTPMKPRAGAGHRNPWFDPEVSPPKVDPVDDIVAPTDVLIAEREPTGSVSAHPMAVPGQYQFLKAWKLITVLAGVWLIAGAIGLGLYYWWFRAPDKTWVEV